MMTAQAKQRGDSSVGEREASSLETWVSNPAPCSPVTPGRIVTAPLPYGGAQWGIYSDRRQCFGAIGSPGQDAETSEANARRVAAAWNAFDDMLAFLGELAEDAVGLPRDVRDRARALRARLGGLQ